MAFAFAATVMTVCAPKPERAAMFIKWHQSDDNGAACWTLSRWLSRCQHVAAKARRTPARLRITSAKATLSIETWHSASPAVLAERVGEGLGKTATL